MKIWLILLPVIAITTINCSKLNSGHGIQIKNDKPNFANKVQLDTETEITIPQFNRELSSFKNNLLTSYEGLSFSEKGLSSIGYINEASGEVYICPEDYTSVYTVVRHETSNIYYLYEESVRTLASDEPHCKSVFQPNKKHVEKKKISTTYDFIFNLPATSIQPPNYIKAYKGFLNNQLRYRLEIRSENTTDINGQPFSEIHKMQAIINPSTNIIRSIEYFEEIVALKDDPSKFTHSYYETFISQDRDPSTIDWGDLPIDDDTE